MSTTTPRVGVLMNYSADFRSQVPEVIEAERLGAGLVAVPEAYSFDGVSRLGYLAAVTSTMALASGILPLYSRTPALLAMTAAGLDDLSGGRFELGIGTSGPQVIEGLHGVPFNAPLGRTRETIEVCRTVWRREPLDFHGRYYDAPLRDGGTGLGKPLKIVGHPVRNRIPISIAALTQKSVTQTATIAEGWIPAFYFPEHAQAAWGTALEEGLAQRDPDLGPLDTTVHVPMLIGDDPAQAIDARRAELALYVGGMGAKGANFYNDLAVRYGYGDIAADVQDLYLAGQKREAAALIPDELVLGTSLIGSESRVRERLQAFLASGVTTVVAAPLAPTPSARAEHLEALIGMLPA